MFRGRFLSKPVESEAYWLSLIRYIDQNPVAAQIVHEGPDYPYGSAFHYVRPRGPGWLSRGEIERAVVRVRRTAGYTAEDYRRVFGGLLGGGTREAIERRIASRREESLLDDLVAASPVGVADWMVRKAELADGTRPGRSWIGSRTVRSAMEEECRSEWRVRSGRIRRLGWPLLEAGLLRYACGLRFHEIALVQNISRSSGQQRVRVHDRLMVQDPGYAAIASRVLARILEEGKSSAGR